MHLKSTLGLLLASILLFSCSYDSLDPAFVEQWFAAQNAPFVEVEFKEEQYIKPAGELPEEHIGADARPPLIAWPEPPRKIDSLIKQYYTVMLDMDNMQPIWIAKSNRNKRNTAFSSNIIEYQTPGPGNYLITVLPVSSDFNTSILDNFQSFMNNVMELALTDLEELAQTVRRAGILGMGIAECVVHKPLTISNISDGDPFDNGLIKDDEPIIEWESATPTSKYYILIKDQYDKINWLARVDSDKKDTRTIDKEYIEFDVNRSPVMGETNHTITVYAVSENFPDINDPRQIERVLNNGNYVLESSSRKVYTALKTWSTGIINGILDSNHISENTNPVETPLIEWKWIGKPNDVKEYYVAITKIGENSPLYLSRINTTYEPYYNEYNTPNSWSEGQKYYMYNRYTYNLNAPTRGTEDEKYYLTVFASSIDDYYNSNRETVAPLIGDQPPNNISDLPDGILAWTRTEFKVTPEAPFAISTPRGILESTHVGSVGVSPHVEWRDAPINTSHYYLVMKDTSSDEINWLIRLDGTDTSSIQDSIIDYIPPELKIFDQEYELTVYACSSEFISSHDTNTLYSNLEENRTGILEKATSRLITKGVESLVITSPSNTNLDENNFGNAGQSPYVSWEDVASSSSSYYLVMRDISNDKINWLIRLDGTDTDNIINTIIDYNSVTGTITGNTYKMSIYGVSNRFTEGSSSTEIALSLENGDLGVLYNVSLSLRAQYNMSVSSAGIVDGILNSAHLSNTNPPIVEWNWNSDADISNIAEYYISLTSEDFNPSGLSMPDWFAKTGPSARSSENSQIVSILGMSGSYDAPYAGDNREYSLSVMAVKQGFAPASLRGVDTASVVPGSELPISMTNNKVLSITTIKFHIPD